MTTKFVKFIASIIASLFLLSPVSALAALGARDNAEARAGEDRMSVKAGIDVNFCKNVSTLSSKIIARLETAQGNLDNRQTQRTTSVGERKEKRAEDLTKIRAKQEADRLAIYAKLEAKATTTAQSQAVAQFKVSMDAAIVARKAAVDSAISAYWASVDSVLKARQAAVQTARQNFSSVTQAAVTKAETDCAAGTSPATVRVNFAASVKAAMEKLKTDRKAIDKFGPQIKALAQTRNAAVKKAMEDFHNAAEKARAELKAALQAS